MDAADRVTMRITAIDSLNSCCRLGHTTNFNSSNVDEKKPFLREVSSSFDESSESEFSDWFGVVTGI